MKELLELIARALVDEPEAVRVEEERSGDFAHLRLHVAPADMGKVIGRGGQIARAIRQVCRAAAVNEGVEVRVDIGDEPSEPGVAHRPPRLRPSREGERKEERPAPVRGEASPGGEAPGEGRSPMPGLPPGWPRRRPGTRGVHRRRRPRPLALPARGATGPAGAAGVGPSEQRTEAGDNGTRGYDQPGE